MIRSRRRPPAEPAPQHLPAGGLLVRFRRRRPDPLEPVPAPGDWDPVRVSIARLAEVGLADHPQAQAICFPSDEVVVCRMCVDDLPSRWLLCSTRAPHEHALVLFGHAADILGARLCSTHARVAS